MKQLQIWNHKSSGETYAVIVDAGIVVEACGALHHTEVAEIVKEGSIFNNDDPELVDWLNDKPDDFQLV